MPASWYQVIHQQDLKPWAFQGIFPTMFQVRFSICCLGDVVHLLRRFQPAPQSCRRGGSCSCLTVRRDLPALRTLSCSTPQSQPSESSSRVPSSSPGAPEGPSHHTVVSVFFTVRLRRCCRIRFFSLTYLATVC